MGLILKFLKAINISKRQGTKKQKEEWRQKND